MDFDDETKRRIFAHFDREMAHLRIDIMKTVLPVAARKPGSQELTRPDFFGTAFAVAPNIFITAAHVWHAAASDGEPCITGGKPDGPLGGAFVEAYELHDDLDIAIMRTSTKPDVTLLSSWLGHPSVDGPVQRVQVLTDLIAFGYPHAVTFDYERRERWNAVFRAFKGHVIVVRGFDRLPNSPAVYEVSTPFPEGLSGAPVLWGHNDRLVVVGIVIGRDSVIYAGEEQRAGIALVADELLHRESALLGGTFAEKLELQLFGVGYGQQ